MGLFVRDKCERLVKNQALKDGSVQFTTSSREIISRKGHLWSTWLEAEESFQPVILWVLREKGVHPTRYSRNFLFDKKISSLPNSLPILYIPLFPTNYKECFSERKPLQIHLRIRGCYTHNHLHISSWFFSTPTSPSLHPWEVLSPNTYHTQSKCWVKFWCC